MIATWCLLFLLPYAIAQSRDPVIIVGAGAAGAKIAYDLSRANISFVIVEATNRVGGRLRQARIGSDGPLVELGANWLQGFREDDPFSKFVLEDIVIDNVPDDTDDYFFVSDGELVPDGPADRVWDRIEEALAGAYEVRRQLALPNDTFTQDMSIAAAMLLSTGWTSRTPMEIAAEQSEIDFEYAASADLVSVTELSPFYDPNGLEYTNRFINDRRGYRRLVDWLLERAGIEDVRASGPNLMLSAPVREISYTNNSAAVLLRDGRRIRGSAVVSTVSLGVLQDSLVENRETEKRLSFRPTLPLGKRVAISKMRIGDYIKLFIRFKTSVFTDQDPLYLAPLSCDEGRWINVHNLNARDHFPGENIVLLTSVDTFAREVLCEDEEVVIREGLEYISLARGRTVERSEVDSVLYYQWRDKQFFRGSFTFTPVGVTKENMEDLNSRVGALFFAGEAHAPSLSGYVQGAVFSGEEVAQNIIDFLAS
eukprot:GFKZ01001403.1.p1 GENE.GFKZ01001403.1~~GFKZ01001403.1.p1  ORF type:complete len:481 (-),score=43.68 GFKZ01001403.1:167-1609(-)